MTVDLFPNGRLFHMMLDIQAEDLKSLAPDRQKAFPKAARQFADTLYDTYGIMTIPVALIRSSDSYKFYPHSRKRNHMIADLGLQAVGVRPHEPLFVKRDDSCFGQPAFGNFLKEQQAGGIILTGMNTPTCVEENLEDGLRQKFRFFVIPDLLADVHMKPRDERNPAKHQKMLQEDLEYRKRKDPSFPLENLSYHSRVEFLQLLETAYAKVLAVPRHGKSGYGSWTPQPVPV